MLGDKERISHICCVETCEDLTISVCVYVQL